MLVGLLLYAAYGTLLAVRRGKPAALLANPARLALMVGLGTALGAIQLLPTAEMNAWGIRGNGLSYAEASTGALKASMLLSAVLPPFWNRAMVALPGNSEFLGYVGASGLVLAVAGVLYSRHAQARFFLLLAAVALLLALGPQNPLYPALFRAVPGLSLFRVPARWLFLYGFSLSILAGLGLHGLLAAGPKRNWRPLFLL